MKKKKIIVISAITTVTAAVSSIITGLIVNRRNLKRYESLQDKYIDVMNDYAQTMEDFTDYICDRNGWDPDDYDFEEDNEDE